MICLCASIPADSADSAANGNYTTAGFRLKDLTAPDTLPGVVRRPGSGRPALTETDPTLLENLSRLLEPATMGDPMRPLLWVSKSHAKLAEALSAMGYNLHRLTEGAALKR